MLLHKVENSKIDKAKNYKYGHRRAKHAAWDHYIGNENLFIEKIVFHSSIKLHIFLNCLAFSLLSTGSFLTLTAALIPIFVDTFYELVDEEIVDDPDDNIYYVVYYVLLTNYFIPPLWKIVKIAIENKI